VSLRVLRNQLSCAESLSERVPERTRDDIPKEHGMISRKNTGTMCFANAACAPNGKDTLEKAFAALDIIIEHLFFIVNSNICGILSKEL
jgi:hypothetical protein